MTRSEIEAAIANGHPFVLRMADGRHYPVPDRDYISLPPTGTYVIVHDDAGKYHVLPFRTMTALEAHVRDKPQ